MGPPVRICCGQAHFGPVCPDNKVMCCLCFERFDIDQLNVTGSGHVEDVCKTCAKADQEMAYIKVLEDALNVIRGMAPMSEISKVARTALSFTQK